MDSNGKIDSQEEYDRELDNFLASVRNMGTMRKLVNPNAYKNFSDIIDRAERIGLFSHEYCAEIRMKIVNGINDPSMKSKISKILKARGFLKGKE